MQKVITLFKRDYKGTRLVLNELVEGSEWVTTGEGRATEKIDGTSCLIRDGKLYKRFDAKQGKIPPSNFESAQNKPDPVTGHWPGWVPVGDGPEDKWYRQAWENRGLAKNSLGESATYELIGPKVQGNKYELTEHRFRLHGDVTLDAPRDFDGLRRYFEENPQYEGIVWHHQDGRLVKLKRRDFGLKW